MIVDHDMAIMMRTSHDEAEKDTIDVLEAKETEGFREARILLQKKNGTQIGMKITTTKTNQEKIP